MNNNLLRRDSPRVAIIGAGRIGTGLAHLLHRAGIDVVLGSRTPLPVPSGTPAQLSLQEAVSDRTVIVLALPHAAIEPNLGLLAGVDPSAVVVDCANAVAVRDGRLTSALDLPHGQWLAARLPGARIVRAFTHVQDELLVSRATRQPDTWGVAVAADDEAAWHTTADLVRATRYVPVPVGDLATSAVLDPGGPLFPNMYLPADMATIVATWHERDPAPPRCGS